jgi:TrmH family RNA methyltransferase
MGSLFALPIVHVDSPDDALDWAKAAGVTVVTTSARASSALGDVRLPAPALILFGSEGDGLPAHVVGRGDLDLRIPMRGTASSLNLAVAAGIVLYLATA